MKVTSRDFQRNFAAMKEKAANGATVTIVSGKQQFTFQAARPRTWQGALKGKGKITGDLFTTGIEWEASK
ncbi:MAG TPA: hypothetical protein VM680_07345 [Verrucomicrobiae bacterium]|nr:hypothetical protein [Verrucomicrobiae bacterium]